MMNNLLKTPLNNITVWLKVNFISAYIYCTYYYIFTGPLKTLNIAQASKLRAEKYILCLS